MHLPIIYSITQGEQGGLPFTITTLDTPDVTGYSFKATLIEGSNTGDGNIPELPRVNAKPVDIKVFVPVNKGDWLATQPYQYRDVVSYNNEVYIKERKEQLTIRSTTPDKDKSWFPHKHNVVYLRIPGDLSDKWLVPPSFNKNVYAFLTMEVTSPDRGLESLLISVRKPLVGYVEIKYDPLYHLQPYVPTPDRESDPTIHYTIQATDKNLYIKHNGLIIFNLDQYGNLTTYGDMLFGGAPVAPIRTGVIINSYDKFRFESAGNNFYIQHNGAVIVKMNEDEDIITTGSFRAGATIAPMDTFNRTNHSKFSISNSASFLVFKYEENNIMTVSGTGDIQISGNLFSGQTRI